MKTQIPSFIIGLDLGYNKHAHLRFVPRWRHHLLAHLHQLPPEFIVKRGDGPSGLGAKLKAIKESVKSQYGNGSLQYNQIKTLRI